jgi:hypothetical protein
MQAAPVSSSGAVPGAAADIASSPSPIPQGQMDREFVLRNQIVERYLSGKLPLKGAQEFERFCTAHPELLDEIGLSERINAALKLLDAGHTTPWEERPLLWWQKLPVVFGVAAGALIFAIVALMLTAKLGASERRVASMNQRLSAQPLDPAEFTRSFTLSPNRTAPSGRSLATIGGATAQMANLHFDVSWSKYAAFRVTIDRVDQGRVAVLSDVLRDSNGQIDLAFNSSALGPGDYQFTIEGLTWKGEPVAQGWATISVVH